MTVFMRKSLGEKSILQVGANSALGRGIFYVTDLAIAYEVDGRGLYLNFIPHKMISRVEISKRGFCGARKLRIFWIEDETEHSFELRTRQYRQLYDTLCKFVQDGESADIKK